MCLFITILALACAWNMELMSTKEEGEPKKGLENKYLNSWYSYVLVYYIII